MATRWIGVARWPLSRRFGGGGEVVVEVAMVMGFMLRTEEILGLRERERESEKVPVDLRVGCLGCVQRSWWVRLHQR